ncbi:MAG TPA: GNVR domain-containing protein [Ramlibacter sp.]|nr:GNVR domain-containing protein [Ramlibacter sp.]
MRFSDERELFAAAGMLPQTLGAPARSELRTYLKPIAQNRWWILLAVLAAVAIGAVVAVAMPPVYEANLLIQIADSAGPSRSVLGDAANVFDIKTPASAEMEIMRSRMVVTPAVEKNDLLVVARPRYFPFLAGGPARGQETVSNEGVFASVRARLQGARRIDVRRFDVPAAWQGQTFIVTLRQDGRYVLSHPSLSAPLEGKVGELLTGSLGQGRLFLLVSDLQGPADAAFSVVRKSRGKAAQDLQNALQLVERGRQSGIIEASLKDTDPARAAAVLNAIGADYVKQAIDRKAAEAEKSIAFLNTQLPTLKDQMERAESAYNRFRSRTGTVSFDDDAKAALQRRYDIKARLDEAEQKKRDLLSNFGAQHPAVRIADDQIAGLQQELRGLQGRISAMPGNQQDAQRLERDAKMSGELYQQFRSNVMHLQLVREGLTGNARIIDPAVPPDESSRPQPAIVLAAAGAGGLVLSLLFVLVRSGLGRGVRSARDIETATGLSVYSSAVPLSARAQRRVHSGAPGVLALSSPGDEAAVALRQLKTMLQHQTRGRSNNRLLVTGPGEGVGAHFVASNIAALMAASGQRVLLIDADRQRGRLHRSFGAEPTPGLAELVGGSCTRKEAVWHSGIPRLDLVPAGSAPLDFGELSESRAFVELLEHATRDYDMVVLAAPPVLRSSETLSLALTAAMIVLVARARKTAVEDIAESARRLTQAGQSLSGVVLNGV